MAVTAFATGTQTTSIGTEHFVSSPNEAGVFTFHVDLDPMAAADIVELRAYQMLLTGGTARVVYYAIFYDLLVDDAKIACSVPILNELAETNAVRFSIKQTAGATNDIKWKVLKTA